MATICSGGQVERRSGPHPAAGFCFAQMAKRGPRRKDMSASIVTRTRSTGQLRGALARIAQAARQIVACYERLGPRRAVGLRRPHGLEVQRSLLRGVGELSWGRPAVEHEPLSDRERRRGRLGASRDCCPCTPYLIGWDEVTD